MKDIFHIPMKASREILFLLVGLISFSTLQAEDFRKVVHLAGYWKFSVGDYMEWAAPGFDDSSWDEIRVPQSWESSGYNEYNGFAWYRKEFRISHNAAEGPLYLILGRIDDSDEVYLNGKLMGKAGSMPPEYTSAYDYQRKYPIPNHLINYEGVNTLAIRVYDSYMEGGIIDGPAGIYVDEDPALLDYDFSGIWKFHLGDNKQWKEAGYNDSNWETVNVPQNWESQGFANYDGYAWYRKEFVLPPQLRDEELYLILGKIDDYDYVYLNGKLIGSVFDLDNDGEYRRRGYEYNARRIYKIPESALKQSGKNVIAVRVYDGQLIGGIYEGPIGIMTYESKRTYVKKHYKSQNFWDYIINEFFYD